MARAQPVPNSPHFDLPRMFELHVVAPLRRAARFVAAFFSSLWDALPEVRFSGCRGACTLGYGRPPPGMRLADIPQGVDEETGE